MIPYASWTGTKRNLNGLQSAGWRLLTGPPIMQRNGWQLPKWTDGTVAPYALDNGAWTAHQQGTEFDSEAFEHAVSIAGRGADWIVIPDIVAAGKESLQFSLSWLPKLELFRVLLAVQDGMDLEDIRPHLSDRVGIFVGGSTEWKLDTMCKWGELAKQVGCYLHIGRVNTCRRIRLCKKAGADSFDGTSATKFISTLPMLDHARRQTTIWELV